MTDNGSSPFNRTAQHDAKRLAILSQASRLFNSKGARATTLSDIASSLGLTKTSLYYYVKTKEELIYQCYRATLAYHSENLDDIEATYPDPKSRLSAFVMEYFEKWLAAREGRGPHIAALMEIASLKGAHREEVEAGYIALFKRIRQYVRDGMADGSFRKLEATAATRAIMGSVEWVFHWLHDIPEGEVRQAADAALDIILHGLYAGAGEYPVSDFSYEPAARGQLTGFDRAQRNRLKQEAFCKTGTRFFNKQGFNGTSLDEIAEQLNVSKGAFYYHIKNKEDLLFNCYSRSLDIIADIYQQAEQSRGTGLEKIEQTCRHIFHVQNGEEGPLIRYYTITALPVDRRREILKRTDANGNRFSAFIDEGMADGSIRPLDATVAQNLFAGAINASMEIGLWRKVEDIDATAVDYFDVFFNGLVQR